MKTMKRLFGIVLMLMVSMVTSAEEAAEIFNLAGQRLQKAQRGVNIVNGKKVLVK